MIPYPLIRPLVIVAVIAAASVGGLLYLKHVERQGAERGRAEATAEFEKINRQAQREADEREAARRVALEKSRARDVAKAKAAAAAADAARIELDRLRYILPATDSGRRDDTSTGPVTDGTALVSEFLGACAQRYVEVAGEADRLTAQVTGLQGYINAVLMRPDRIEGGCLGAAECPRAGVIVSLVTQAAAEPSGGIQLSTAPPKGLQP